MTCPSASRTQASCYAVRPSTDTVGRQPQLTPYTATDKQQTLATGAFCSFPFGASAVSVAFLANRPLRLLGPVAACVLNAAVSLCSAAAWSTTTSRSFVTLQDLSANTAIQKCKHSNTECGSMCMQATLGTMCAAFAATGIGPRWHAGRHRTHCICWDNTLW